MTLNTTKAKHTPGPWRIESETFNVRSDRGLLIARVSYRACANARLIAAAPDLLAACKAIVANEEHGKFLDRAGGSLREWQGNHESALRACASAIAKAEGGAT